MRWQPAAVATVLVALALAWPYDVGASWTDGVWCLRVIAGLVTLACAFVLDDQAADIIAPSPTPLRARTLFRVGLAAAWAVPVWSVSLLVVAPRIPDVWMGWASLEFAALLVAGLATAALAARRYGQSEPGAVASAAIVGGWLLMLTLPGPVSLFTLRPEALLSAHLRWTLLLGAGLAVMATMSRDPALTRR
ncbi:hypothetical protein [Microtetraspora glauca]|uniref:ABC transporter n=1 Tax=Microtetraspora glauca TaxID=1996 RepID=A0ABV3GMN0_MICGL